MRTSGGCDTRPGRSGRERVRQPRQPGSSSPAPTPAQGSRRTTPGSRCNTSAGQQVAVYFVFKARKQRGEQYTWGPRKYVVGPMRPVFPAADRRRCWCRWALQVDRRASSRLNLDALRRARWPHCALHLCGHGSCCHHWAALAQGAARLYVPCRGYSARAKGDTCAKDLDDDMADAAEPAALDEQASEPSAMAPIRIQARRAPGAGLISPPVQRIAFSSWSALSAAR